MATKRTKRTAARIGLSEAVLEAWRIGDFHGVNRALNIAPHQVSPFDAIGEAPPWKRPWHSWERAVELRRALIAVAGEPGGVGRHGEPLGAGVPSYRDWRNGDNDIPPDEGDHSAAQ